MTNNATTGAAAAPGGQETVSSGTPLVRKPGIGRAEFREAWLSHGALVASWFVEKGVRTYSQLHMPDHHPGDLSAEDARLLELIDGVACVQIAPGPNPQPWSQGGAGNSFLNVVLSDETRFLHEECGAGAVKREPPSFLMPEKTAQEWREWALGLGATEHAIIEDGEVVIDVPQEVMDRIIQAGVF